MKYVVFLGDGMADTPVEALEGKTPLMVAKKENIDALAPFSEVGLAKTVPDGMKPGSDTANLAVMGYDPKHCYSGRSPLEALSMGLELAETDIAVRCNLVTLSDEENYADKKMIDYSAGEISTEEARELIDYVNRNLGDERLSFHGGISYRHCLIVHNAETGSTLTPPHDITGKKIKRHLPSGKLGDLFLDLEKKSYDLLKDHPINVKRIAEGKNPANSVWFWGEGTKPSIPDFYEKNGIRGAVISAVDLLKGIGKGANMEVIDVPGATGNINTDFAAKGKAAIEALKRLDYVYIHVEAPDESGHQGSLKDKIASIEKIDAEIVGPVLAYLKDCGEAYHVLVCPDHPTPLATRTHSADPIPYLLYKSDHEIHSGVDRYDEETARSTGIFTEEGFHLIDKMLSDTSEGHIEGLTPDLVTFGDGSEAALKEED
ncbi:MAG: cofactor-independent phosphoglycerate mutase, partial [Clostridia bacterium]|nr:cofactor-independent phosphoglycerate mutase [Clostridia bacterium]